MPRRLFVEPAGRELYPDWAAVAAETVARLRLDAGLHPTTGGRRRWWASCRCGARTSAGPLFTHGGDWEKVDWEKVFSGFEFDGDGRVSRLQVTYPAYFTDSEAASRARIEQLLHAKSGRGRCGRTTG